MTAVGYPAGAPLGAVRGRWAWTAVGLALAAAAVGIWVGRTVSTQFRDSYATLPVTQRTFSAPVHDVVVSVQDGTVVIERGSGTAATVRTWGTRTVRTPTDREQLANGELQVRSTCGLPTPAADFCRRDYLVRVPADDSVTAAVATGNLDVSGLAGSVQLADGTGSVVVRRTAGTVDVTTATGPIDAAGTRGPLTLDARNGDVTVSGASGRLTVSSETGDVAADGLTGSTVSVSAANGSVALAFAAAPQQVTASTETGDVTVVLPPGTPTYQLDLTSRTGRVDSSLASDPTSSRVVKATTANGNVTVTAGSFPVMPVQPVRPVQPVPPVVPTNGPST